MSEPFGPVRVSHDGGKTFQPAPPELAAVLSQLQASDAAPAADTAGPQGENALDPEPPLALGDWWLLDASQMIAATEAKAVEYSSYDLLMIGRVQADMLGIKDATEAQQMELGCLFYLLGKVARAVGAIKDGRTPSDDTYFDTLVYVQMIRRLRAVGSWPGNPQ